ncbi:transglutaminase domain-containing protein [Butyrivibrio sp. AD3002]|uniref:transglutaminase domain-containing protein n=1 Tax=Butyrivibrio sp. AD3002 TaxID=1280670 RepID=UPI0003B5399B|nr:transglutaminase-like domain-containing protein [Butyrivibrio sp. AD3002]
MKKQALSVLSVLLGICLVTGCGGSSGINELTKKVGGFKSSESTIGESDILPTDDQNGDKDVSSNDDQKGTKDVLSNNKKSGTIDVLSNIKNKYASATVDSAHEFGEPMYNLPKDYVFEFDCNEEAMKWDYNMAFSVYTTLDFENPDKYTHDCSVCSLENGKILVEPSAVDNFYDIPESTITAETDTFAAWETECDGTWGSLNKLYLVQKYDLQTGEELAKPIITPFSIRHDIESTTVKQKIDDNNNYYLEWTPVRGASSYLVFKLTDLGYYLVYKTTDTKASADSFWGQLDSDRWSELVNKDLEESGYDTTTSEKLYMNSDLHDDKHCKFAVVAVRDGKTSGISNIVDSDELADLLPYTKEGNLEVTIRQVSDLPVYINVTTVNDKTMQMIIDYHGCVCKHGDDDSTTYYLFPKIYHTDLSPFLITVHGMPYGEFTKYAQQVADRQDKITATMPTGRVETNVDVSNVPTMEDPEVSENPETSVEPAIPEEPTSQEEPEAQEEPTTQEEPEVQEQPTTQEEPTTQVNPGSANELMTEVADMVNTNLTLLQEQSGVSLDDVIFAESPLEEWMAYCLMARSEYIPVPYSEFPEGADVEGTTNKLLSMYRQNPTSGVINGIKYSYDYETYIVEYVDDTNDRLGKSVEEFKKAKEVADCVTAGLSTDYDKVVALNDYFCTNASYDESSMSTEVDMNSLTQSFIDAHTPYGILCNNYGVCESYSEAMALAGRLAGLDVIIETGDLYGAGGHEWNRVNIDGNWCILDITNNDNEMVPNGLCNITDSMATQLLISDKTSYLFDASANTDSYEYYHMNGEYVESTTDLADKLREQLDSDGVAHVRCSENMTQDDVTAVAQQLYSEGYDISEGYFVYNIAILSK